MDPFRRIPAEIVRIIIQNIPDFVGLESVILVSAQFNAVIRSEPPVALLNDLIQSNPVLERPEIHRLFCQIVLIHDPSVFCGNVNDYNCLISQTIDYGISWPTSSSQLLKIIKIAAQLQRLACACLLAMQRNFCKAVKTYSAGSLLSTGRVKNYAMIPSWIEEYRVYWALWHLRHYSDLQRVSQSAVSSSDISRKSCFWNWSSSSVEQLDKYAVWNGLAKPNGLLSNRMEEIWSVAAVLGDLGLHPLYGCLGQPEEEPTQAFWYLPPEKSMPLFTSFELPHLGIDDSIWCSPPVPDDTEINKVWHLSSKSSDDVSAQSLLFRTLENLLVRRRPAASSMLNIRPYRRLGVFVWDKWRLYSAGLMYNSSREKAPGPLDGFVEASDVSSESLWAMQSRWLALIGGGIL